MLRISFLTALLFGFLQGLAQPKTCDISKDSVLNIWYRNYQMNFVRGDKWKAASLGMQILRYCPDWKPELYRETGLLYQDILDTSKSLGLRMLLKDTLYSIYNKAASQTGDSASWYLVRAAAAMRYEDQSDSILALMLEPAIRLNPLRCPPQIIEDFFRIQDWKTRRGKMDTLELELSYQHLNVILARQYLFKDSAREKEQIQKIKTSMACRMARYLPDTATIIQEAKSLQSDQYSEWLRIYARLFARNVEQQALLQSVRLQLSRTGTETIWEARRLVSSGASSSDWNNLSEKEKDPWMKAWYLLQAAHLDAGSREYENAWKLLSKAYTIAPNYGAIEVALARLLMRVMKDCNQPDSNTAILREQACAYFNQAGKKDFRYRNLANQELPEVVQDRKCVSLTPGSRITLKCNRELELIIP